MMNKKFIFYFFICLILSLFLLFSVNIFLLQKDKKILYSNSTINFEDFNKNNSKGFDYNISSSSRKFLSYGEAKNEINYKLFSHIMDITVKYNVDNILDYEKNNSTNLIIHSLIRFFI